MEYGGYLIGLVALIVCGALYGVWKARKRRDDVLEFRPHADATGDRIEFVVRKRGL